MTPTRKWVMPHHLAIDPELAVVGTCTSSPVEIVLASDYDALAKQLATVRQEREQHGQDYQRLCEQLATTQAQLAAAEAKYDELLYDAHNQPLLKLKQTQQRLATLEAAVRDFFGPGLGIATPEYHTWPNGKRDDSDPYKKTWNDKLDRLRHALAPADSGKEQR